MKILLKNLNSGKKDNINSKPNSGKWNQPFQNAANSAVKTGIEAQKSSYVPSFMGSGNDSARKGKTIICLNFISKKKLVFYERKIKLFNFWRFDNETNI